MTCELVKVVYFHNSAELTGNRFLLGAIMTNKHIWNDGIV